MTRFLKAASAIALASLLTVGLSVTATAGGSGVSPLGSTGCCRLIQ
ncbi:hypothetical protein ACGIF2_03545 [Cellulomonas sp. P22]